MISTFILYTLAALACAICNGSAAVLQKVGADTQKPAKSFSFTFTRSLLQNWPYIAGIILDIAAWIFTLIAVHGLPLFVVQPIIAFSVVVTVIVERLAFNHRLSRRTIVAIALIIIGLLTIALQSTVESTTTLHGNELLAIVLAPLVLGVVGLLIMGLSNRYTTVVLAAIAGTAFGGVAICGRILKFSQPYWHVLYSPPFLALFLYGLVGIATFTIALQQARASVVNAAMITFETLVPIAVGAFMLNDVPKNGSWIIVILGATLALIGTIAITTTGTRTTKLIQE
jgi:drug/metabolite transporter (DMT)-like permease